MTCSDPAAAAASSGSVDLSAITDDASADATGTATCFRIVDSDSTFVMDGDVDDTACDMVLNSVEITAGGTVSITSFTINAPNA